MKEKFKIGDTVKFIGNGKNHGPVIPENAIGIINDFNEEYTSKIGIYFKGVEGYNRCSEDELKLIRHKQFTKSDLKDNHIVVYENGVKEIWSENTNKSILKEDLTRSHETYTEVIEVWEFDKCVWKREEKPVEILDEVEKKYLSDVIRPFRKKIILIKKINGIFSGQEKLQFLQDNNYGYFELPFFIKGTMYQGMELNKKYTLEELGLED